MFVKMWRTENVVTVDGDLPILEARNIMKEKRIRRLPVMNNGRLVGIVTEGDIQEASPSDATSLSIWELNYLLAKTTIQEVMAPRSDMSVVSPDDPIEKVALLMRERKISGMPVVDGEDKLLGIITESDIFSVFLYIMGVSKQGARLTLALKNEPGSLAPVMQIFKDHQVGVLSIVTCDECRNKMEELGDNSLIVVHIEGYDYTKIVQALQQAGILIMDARN